MTTRLKEEIAAWTTLLRCKIINLVSFDVDLTILENTLSLAIYDGKGGSNYRVELKEVPWDEEKLIKVLALLCGPQPRWGWDAYGLYKEIEEILPEQ